MMVNQLDSSIHLVIVAYRASCVNVLRLPRGKVEATEQEVNLETLFLVCHRIGEEGDERNQRSVSYLVVKRRQI